MISLKNVRNEKLISLALAATFIFTSFSSLILTSCKKGDDKKVKPADYGSYGSDLARKIASDFPERKPYSEGEKGAGEAIKEEMVRLKYEPEVQSFTCLKPAIKRAKTFPYLLFNFRISAQFSGIEPPFIYLEPITKS